MVLLKLLLKYDNINNNNNNTILSHSVGNDNDIHLKNSLVHCHNFLFFFLKKTHQKLKHLNIFPANSFSNVSYPLYELYKCLCSCVIQQNIRNKRMLEKKERKKVKIFNYILFQLNPACLHAGDGGVCIIMCVSFFHGL